MRVENERLLRHMNWLAPPPAAIPTVQFNDPWPSAAAAARDNAYARRLCPNAAPLTLRVKTARKPTPML